MRLGFSYQAPRNSVHPPVQERLGGEGHGEEAHDRHGRPEAECGEAGAQALDESAQDEAGGEHEEQAQEQGSEEEEGRRSVGDQGLWEAVGAKAARPAAEARVHVRGQGDEEREEHGLLGARDRQEPAARGTGSRPGHAYGEREDRDGQEALREYDQ